MAKKTQATLVPTTDLQLAPEAGGAPAPASAPIEEAAEYKKTKIADRDWINDAGESVAEEEATGVRYKFLGRTKDGVTIPGDNADYVLKFASLTPKARDMLTGFGAITLMGNVTNTWMGEKSEDKDPRACDAIAARFALLQSGTWIDRTREGVGRAVDKDALARSIVAVGVQLGKIPAADEGTKVVEFRGKLEDATYARDISKVPQIAAEYARQMGRTVKSVDDVFAGL